MQQHALFPARTKPTPRRWLCFGNTNQSEGARVQARCKNSAGGAVVGNTLLPPLLLLMELPVQKASRQSLSPCSHLPWACAIQILWAATDQNALLMGAETEWGALGPNPNTHTSQFCCPFLAQTSLDFHFCVCASFYFSGIWAWEGWVPLQGRDSLIPSFSFSPVSHLLPPSLQTCHLQTPPGGWTPVKWREREREKSPGISRRNSLKVSTLCSWSASDRAVAVLRGWGQG